jgi:ABC-type glycerol-3-phosphate transport system substrate-binding protein
MKSLLATTSLKRICLLLALSGALFCFGCSRPSANGPVVIHYWEKWTGFESDAMQSVVDDFNASQNRIHVEYSSIGELDRKFMMATAGGVPPDVAGIWCSSLPVYAENNALTPLDQLARQYGITREKYIDVYWRLCSYRDHLWALPSTPTTLALIWNKKAFREAGLDPERPPRTIDELDEYNRKLTKFRPDGSIEAMGYVPGEPDSWDAMMGYFFGGALWDGNQTITADSPANLEAFRWVESYSKRYGAEKLITFRAGFGNMASSQNPFFTGRVAMELQGVWMYNYIKNYAPPDFEWGAAPFPTSDPAKLHDTTIAECDGLVIPTGARHPQEAFEFIAFVNSQKEMEKLCMAQRKFSPLVQCSPDFLANHPNPYIRVFLDLAKSPNATLGPPRLISWTQYKSNFSDALSRIQAGHATADEALRDVQVRQQKILDQDLGRWNRVGPELTAEWGQP